MMMKSKALFVIAVILLFLGISLFVIYKPNQENRNTYPATVYRDCAPWDGAAFTVQIPLGRGDVIDISIWKSPEIQIPITFTFPDDTGQTGNAILSHHVGQLDALSGTVRFQSVVEGQPVRGSFNLHNESGEIFEGSFEAEWDDQFFLCG
jgi:hypothetical protein